MNLCLESVDKLGAKSPMVKLIHKNSVSQSPQQERYYTVLPFHDGATEYEGEDLGWMYLPLHEYLQMHSLLGKSD